MQAPNENFLDQAQQFFTPLPHKPHEAQQFLLSPGAEEPTPCLRPQEQPRQTAEETPPCRRGQDHARQIAELRRTLRLQTAELAELAEMQGSRAVDPNQSWEHLRTRQEAHDASLTEALSLHDGNVDELSARNRQLESSVKELADIQESMSTFRHERVKLDAQAHEFFKLKETSDLQNIELIALRRDNLRMETQLEEVNRIAERREKQIAVLHEEIGALRHENKHLESDRLEAKQLQQEESRKLHSTECELEELREMLSQQAADLEDLQNEREALQSRISEVESTSKTKLDIFEARQNLSIATVLEMKPEFRDRDDNKENEVIATGEKGKLATSRKHPLGPMEPQTSFQREPTRSSAHGNRSRQVEEISDVLCDDASAMTTPMRRLTEHDSAEFPNGSGRLWQQLEDPLELCYASEEPIARNTSGDQQPRRWQRGDHHGAQAALAPLCENVSQEASQRQRQGWTIEEDAAWSLTSLSGSSGGREATNGVTPTVTPSSAGGLTVPAFLEREVAGLCGAVVDEPWRLVCAVLGVLDAMQRKLGTSALQGHKAPPRSPDWWRSVQTVDIRVLVAVDTSSADSAVSGVGGCNDEGKKQQGQSGLNGGTFMYVLV